MSTHPSRSSVRPVVAREQVGAYEPGGLSAAVDAQLAVRIDELDETEIRAELATIETATRQLQVRAGELASALVARQARRIRDANPNDHRAGQKASKQVTDELRDSLQWTPSRTKQTLKTARHLSLASSPETRDAYRAGQLTGDHARVLADTLQHLHRRQRDEVEPELVAAARTQDPVTFGRTCRARLAEIDAAAAQRAAARRHQRRYGRASQDPDGMLRVSAGFAGLDAEFVATAIEAYRTTDTVAGQRRTPEQRTADAIVAMARAALDHGRPSTAHGHRPHVVVHVDWQTLVAGTGNADTVWTGPLPASEIRRLLDDCTISRVVTGPDSLPLDIGRATRNVPAGVWRGIVARDRTCTSPAATPHPHAARPSTSTAAGPTAPASPPTRSPSAATTTTPSSTASTGPAGSSTARSSGTAPATTHPHPLHPATRPAGEATRRHGEAERSRSAGEPGRGRS